MEYTSQNLGKQSAAGMDKKSPSKKLTIIGLVLFAILIVSPLIFALLIGATSGKDAQKLDVIQIIVMGVYNLPAVLISLAFVLAGLFTGFRSIKASNILYALSIVASIVGILINASWFIFSLYH